MDNNVSDINFKCSCFSWLEEYAPHHDSKKRSQSFGGGVNGENGSSQPPSLPQANSYIPEDPITRTVRNLTTRVVQFRNSELSGQSNATSSNISPEHRMSNSAKRWKIFLEDLMKIPSLRITEELLSAFADILRINCNFFAMHIDSWNEFETLQLVSCLFEAFFLFF